MTFSVGDEVRIICECFGCRREGRTGRTATVANVLDDRSVDIEGWGNFEPHQIELAVDTLFSQQS